MKTLSITLAVALVAVVNVASATEDDSPIAYFKFETMGGSSRVGIQNTRNIESTTKEGKLSHTRWKIKASGPVNKSADKTDLATLDGLVNSFKLGAEFSYLRQLMKDFDTSPMLDLGISGSVGYETFKYLNPDGGEDLQDEKVPWEGGAHIALNPGGIPILQRLRVVCGYKYQEAYKAAGEVIRCESPDTSGFQICKKGAKACPKDDNKSLGYIQLKVLVPIGWKWLNLLLPGSIALAPKYTHDFETETNGVDVPFYFLVDDKSNLTGGCRVGWRDDTEDVTVGVFVGTAFDIWGTP